MQRRWPLKILEIENGRRVSHQNPNAQSLMALFKNTVYLATGTGSVIDLCRSVTWIAMPKCTL